MKIAEWILRNLMKFFKLDRFYFEKITITEEFLKQASSYAIESHPYECYGVLRGKIIDKNLHLLAITFVMHKSEKNNVLIKPTLFSNPKGFGTFHSHPSGNTLPSRIDLESFLNNPVNIIIGYPYSTKNISIYDHRGKTLNFNISKINIDYDDN